MNDFISRQTLLDRFRESCNGECGCCEYNGSDSDTGENCRIIVETPAADVHPVKFGKLTGEWLEYEYGYCRCSICGYELDDAETTTPYCPICGAKMESEDK